MKGLAIFLSIVATLVSGLCVGAFFAYKNAPYKEVQNVEKLNGSKVEEKAQVEEEPKEAEKESTNSVQKEKKVETVKTQKVESKKDESKDYDIYYYLADVLYRSDGVYFVVDMIYFYHDSNYLNDYYIVNDNPKLRTYKVSENARFKILDYNNMYNSYMNVSYDEFVSTISTDDILDITIKGDKIVGIKEVYVP